MVKGVGGHRFTARDRLYGAGVRLLIKSLNVYNRMVLSSRSCGTFACHPAILLLIYGVYTMAAGAAATAAALAIASNIRIARTRSVIQRLASCGTPRRLIIY